jgi:hypothetical protein
MLQASKLMYFIKQTNILTLIKTIQAAKKRSLSLSLSLSNLLTLARMGELHSTTGQMPALVFS